MLLQHSFFAAPGQLLRLHREHFLAARLPFVDGTPTKANPARAIQRCFFHDLTIASFTCAVRRMGRQARGLLFALRCVASRNWSKKLRKHVVRQIKHTCTVCPCTVTKFLRARAYCPCVGPSIETSTCTCVGSEPGHSLAFAPNKSTKKMVVRFCHKGGGVSTVLVCIHQ
jgi:hypothetical protein